MGQEPPRRHQIHRQISAVQTDPLGVSLSKKPCSKHFLRHGFFYEPLPADQALQTAEGKGALEELGIGTIAWPHGD